MTYGTSFQHNAGDKTRLAAEEYSRQCNASPEDGGYNNNNNNNNIATVQLQATTDQKKNHYNTHKSSSKLKCPASISKLRVEKIEGGLMVAGVVVAANCQLALPAFGFLFMLVGAVLTAASYRGPGVDEDLNSYAARIAFTGNSRVLGPICIVVGGLMLALGALLCSLSRRARKRERRVGFHCPLHGDFYPLSPSHGVKLLAGDKNKSGWSKKIPCLRSCGGKWGKTQQSPVAPPQCPHSVLSSTRSSVSSSPLSPCPTPMPFLVSSNSMSGIMHIGAATATAVTIPPDPQNFGSIKSLSVTREIASFPLSRTPTPPTQHRLVSSSTSTEELPIVSILPDSPARFQPEAVVISVPPQPQPPRKSVSIVLPEDQLQNHMG